MSKGQTGTPVTIKTIGKTQKKNHQARTKGLARYRELKRKQQKEWTYDRHQELVKLSKRFNL